MGMNVSADDLREIAATVDKLQEADLDVRIVKVRGHEVHLLREEGQRSGISYRVRGITNNITR